MVERRPLTEGLKPHLPPVDPQKEKAFVYGEKAPKEATPPQSVAANLNRVPLSTRIRGDFAAALKRCSLERQLHGIEPNTLQDILEQAIEPWLKSNGYLRQP
ncbi:MAG: hypothetical protein WCB27_25410 [Thermoguttaceae bacterium]|jgi:hypothetical protein